MLRKLTSNPEFNERVVHKAQRRIWGAHTYAHRAESIVRAVAPERCRPVVLPSVSALVSTTRPEQLDQIFQTAGGQADVDLELIVLTRGFAAAEGLCAELAHAHGVAKYQVLAAPAALTLGECLNRCVEASTGAVLTRMDDADYYAPNYVADLLYALSYSGADVVGKQSHYSHLRSSRTTVLRAAHQEHRFGRRVMGPTITAPQGGLRGAPRLRRWTGARTPPSWRPSRRPRAPSTQPTGSTTARSAPVRGTGRAYRPGSPQRTAKFTFSKIHVNSSRFDRGYQID